jgi:hypothetical protein
MAPVANPPNDRTFIQHFRSNGSPRAGDRTVFGDGRPDSGGIVRGDDPPDGGGSVWLCGSMVGRNGSSGASWFVLVIVLGRSGKGAAQLIPSPVEGDSSGFPDAGPI